MVLQLLQFKTHMEVLKLQLLHHMSQQLQLPPMRPQLQLHQATVIQLQLIPIVDLTDDVFDNTIDGEPIIAEEPVIHPGGSQSVDYNKVSHVGVHSVVQAASAQVPDQSHPEKYLNHNHDWVVNVVEHNLWRKETKKFKHHHHGEKLRVIPHLHQASI